MKYIASLVLFAAVATTGCSHAAPAASATAAPEKSPVQTGVVRQGHLDITVSGLGAVGGGANAQASLAFPQAGRIASVDVKVGERVAAGSVLGRLDPGPFESEVRQAEASLAAARANATKASAGARPQQLAQTNAQIDSARTQRSVNAAKLRRAEQLLNVGIGTQADVESARADVANADSALRLLEQQQSAQITPWAPDVEAARAAVAQADAQVSAARQKQEGATLHAPFDGTVTARLHQDGETVDTTSPVIGLARSGSTVFTAQFAPGDAQRIHTGDAAEVSVNGTTSPARGRVVALSLAQNADARTVPVLINLERNGVAFGPGAYGNATIRVGSRRGVWVPSGAVVADPTTGVTQVFRKKGERYEPVQVAIAAERAGRSWLRDSGLRVGDVVVTQGAYALIAPPVSANGDDGK